MSQPTTEQLFQQAVEHHQAGRLEAAEASYREVLRSTPAHASAMHWLGMIIADRGNVPAGEQLIAKSVELNPSAEFVADYASILGSAGRVADAERTFNQALSIDPGSEYARRQYSVFLYNQGELDRVAGRVASAIDRYRAAGEINPNLFEAFDKHRKVLQEQSRLAESLEPHRRALSLRSDSADLHFEIGNVLFHLAQYAEAAAAYETCLNLRPDDGPAASNLGHALWGSGRNREARKAYERACKLLPSSADAHLHLGAALYREGDLTSSIELLTRATQLNPNLAEAHLNLGNALKDAGRLDDAIAAYRRAVGLQPDSRNWSNLLYARHLDPAFGPRELAAEHAAWNRALVLPLLQGAAKPVRNWDDNRRLRIGYVSGDFREHSVGRFILPLLRHHDHQRFEIYCYSDVTRESVVTQTLKRHADAWRQTAGMPDAKLAELIAADQIDILVDLAMHTEHNRMLAFARKPAPVQLTYLAYCSTTGSQAIDYRFTDHFLDPSDDDQPFYSERSVGLRSYWCYVEIIGAPPVAPLPAASNGYVTFACLNNFAKASPQSRGMWCDILRRLPSSRLILHSHAGSHRDAILKEFAEHGISSDRIEFLGFVPLLEYLAAYNRIDIALDPTPYSGGTTTCDALWMGVPVVTLSGRTAVSRSGASILSQIGQQGLIATSTEQYVEIAAGLGSNLDRLRAMRSGMRERMRRSPLMDQVGFARDVEKNLREMWMSRCALAHFELGNQKQEEGDPAAAIDAYQRALAIRPEFSEAHNNMGVALTACGRAQEAAAEFAAAARINPNYADAQNNNAISLRENGKLDEAIAAARQALAVKPDFPAARITLGNALVAAGELDAAIDCFRKAVAVDPFSQAYDNLLYVLNLHPAYDGRRIAAELAQWERIVAQPVIPVGKRFANDRSPQRRLRVGFVSPDFRNHTIGRFIQPLFEHHDPSQIEIAAYAEVVREDWLTRSLRGFASIWRDTRGVPDDVLARQIEADQIDILIDLAMHSDGSRLVAFALKPAPVQATYLAYCGSTGLHTIDYRISDNFIDPPGVDETIYAEKTARLETFWCYVPPPGLPVPAERISDEPVVFGCLNNFSKINPSVLACWADVLRQTDGATLLVHSGEGSHRSRLLAFFEERHVDPQRVRFIGHQNPVEYFASYSQIDVALDPFPFGGGTTTCDALWMGVPVVTFAGQTPCSRGGASILNQIGLPELVTHDPEQYVQTATALARDAGRRAWLRMNLREMMSRSPLMDAPRFARSFESLLRTFWRMYCRLP